MTALDRASWHIPSARGAVPATSFGLRRKAGLPMRRRQVPRRQCRIAKAATSRAAARRMSGIPAETEECRGSCSPFRRVHRVSNDLLGLALDCPQVSFVMEALGVDLVDVFGA